MTWSAIDLVTAADKDHWEFETGILSIIEALARFSHRIISLRDDFVRRVISVLVGMRHRGVKRRERLWYFPGCVGSEELISVGLGVMPRGLRVAAARVRRARPARWRQRRDAWQRSPRYGLPDTLTPSQP